jgi:tRNA nucleotidyltransferase (CCA-adding enzyme)
MKINQIFDNVLNSIALEKKEKKVLEIIKQYNVLFESEIKNSDVFIGGSLAKGTWLKELKDVDLYVRFDYEKYKDKTTELSNFVEKVLIDAKIKYERLHGSRDYFQIKEHDFIVEIIPILRIDDASKALNITDISPLHVMWVKKHSKYVNDIRLAKMFAKANNFYGAESYIKGFSGYSLEILIIYSEGFLNLLREIITWEPVKVIDITKTHKDVFKELNSSKINNPIILIDPVDKQRNVCAGLSYERFELFQESAKAFLENPSEDFFVEKDFNILKINMLSEKSDNYLIKIRIELEENKEDINGCKILKIKEHLQKQLKIHDFYLVYSDFYYDKKRKGFVWFEIKKEKMGEVIEKQGPPLAKISNVKKFKKKHPNNYIKDKRVYSTINREYLEPVSLVKDVINSKYVLDKVKFIEILD